MYRIRQLVQAPRGHDVAAEVGADAVVPVPSVRHKRAMVLAMQRGAQRLHACRVGIELLSLVRSVCTDKDSMKDKCPFGGGELPRCISIVVGKVCGRVHAYAYGRLTAPSK